MPQNNKSLQTFRIIPFVFGSYPKTRNECTDFLEINKSAFYNFEASLMSVQNAILKIVKEPKEIYLNSPHIAGFQYYNSQEIEKEIKENDTFILKREPQNSHDFCAFEVFRKNTKLGYLPLSDNKVVARMMDHGLELKAQIRHIAPDAHPYWRVKMRVYYEMENK